MISGDQAIEALRAVVKGHEGFVYRDEYKKCAYAGPEGEPRCVVGHGLRLIDPDLLAIAAQAERRVGGSLPIVSLTSTLGLSFEAQRIFESAQLVQDTGGTWGEALITAEFWYAGFEEVTV